MSNEPSWIRDLEISARGLPVLLVEGPDDVEIYRHFFTQHKPDWNGRLHIAPALGKHRVITAVTTHRPDWIGIVDSDERSTEEIQKKIADSPHLQGLRRFCIESYFCVPTEIWEALPSQKKAQRAFADFSQPILEALP